MPGNRHGIACHRPINKRINLFNSQQPSLRWFIEYEYAKKKKGKRRPEADCQEVDYYENNVNYAHVQEFKVPKPFTARYEV